MTSLGVAGFITSLPSHHFSLCFYSSYAAGIIVHPAQLYHRKDKEQNRRKLRCRLGEQRGMAGATGLGGKMKQVTLFTIGNQEISGNIIKRN